VHIKQENAGISLAKTANSSRSEESSLLCISLNIKE
jgi:hypothetical protein